MMDSNFLLDKWSVSGEAYDDFLRLKQDMEDAEEVRPVSLSKLVIGCYEDDKQASGDLDRMIFTVYHGNGNLDDECHRTWETRKSELIDAGATPELVDEIKLIRYILLAKNDGDSGTGPNEVRLEEKASNYNVFFFSSLAFTTFFQRFRYTEADFNAAFSRHRSELRNAEKVLSRALLAHLCPRDCLKDEAV